MSYSLLNTCIDNLTKLIVHKLPQVYVNDILVSRQLPRWKITPIRVRVGVRIRVGGRWAIFLVANCPRTININSWVNKKLAMKLV